MNSFSNSDQNDFDRLAASNARISNGINNIHGDLSETNSLIKSGFSSQAGILSSVRNGITSVGRGISNVYNNNKEFAKGAELRQRIVDSGNYTIDDIYNLANAYVRVAENTTDETVKKDALTRAKKAADEVIEKQPDDVSNYYLNSRIMLLSEATEFDGTALDAYQKLEKAVDAHKDNKNANYYYQMCYRYMANYYLKQGQNDKSKEYFTKWLQLDPNNEQLRKYVEGLQ